tara:strand:- start:26 stop:265 length:240 start_codon:yes stop_codon:yes gene_type:complete
MGFIFMYVCACNGINQKQVREAVKTGVSRWDEVHAYHGCTPCCGKCKEEIVQVISEIENSEADVNKVADQPSSLLNPSQ